MSTKRIATSTPPSSIRKPSGRIRRARWPTPTALGVVQPGGFCPGHRGLQPGSGDLTLVWLLAYCNCGGRLPEPERPRRRAIADCTRPSTSIRNCPRLSPTARRALSQERETSAGPLPTAARRRRSIRISPSRILAGPPPSRARETSTAASRIGTRWCGWNPDLAAAYSNRAAAQTPAGAPSPQAIADFSEAIRCDPEAGRRPRPPRHDLLPRGESRQGGWTTSTGRSS